MPSTYRRISRQPGFTLLELSIVIVVIALVIGGVLAGEALIRAAQLRAIVSEYDQYTKATKEFIDKYHALPGDMNNAEDMWGTDGTCHNTNYISTPLSTTVTCNGNGDGKIADCIENMNCVAAQTPETWRAWQHLAQAGFISGRYTGRPGPADIFRAEVGTNVPASKRVPAGWTMMYYQNPDDETWLKGDAYGHVLLLGGDEGAYSGQFTTEPVLFVKETYELDKKVDDGFPHTGKLRAWKNYWLPSSKPGPTAGAGTSYCIREVDGEAQYYIYRDDSSYVCSLIFILGF